MKMFKPFEVVEQMRKVAYESDLAFATSLGVEIECFVYDDDGNPIDLTAYPDLLSKVPNVWGSGTDLGLNMLEFAFNPQSNLTGYIQSAKCAFKFLAEHEPSCNWNLLFAGSAWQTMGWVQKPRYNAAINAIIKEDPERGPKVVDCMTGFAALQINLGVSQFGGVFSHEAKKLLFAFSNWGPALCLLCEERVGDTASERIAHAYDFATDYRGARYLSWEFCDNLERELLEIPQLIVRKPDDVWESYGKKPDTINPLHTGTIYWLARAQGVYDKDAARIEIRSLNSMTPVDSVHTLRVTNQLVAYVLETEVNDLPILTEDEWQFIRQKQDPQASLEAAHLFLEKLPVTL
jgi:hypothetical protein